MRTFKYFNHPFNVPSKGKYPLLVKNSKIHLRFPAHLGMNLGHVLLPLHALQCTLAIGHTWGCTVTCTAVHTGYGGYLGM